MTKTHIIIPRTALTALAIALATPAWAAGTCLLDTNDSTDATANVDTTGGAAAGMDGSRLACGFSSTAAAANSTAVGYDSEASGIGSTAIGASSNAGGNGGIALGTQASTSATTHGNIAIGASSGTVAGPFNGGTFTTANGGNAIALGTAAQATGSMPTPMVPSHQIRTRSRLVPTPLPPNSKPPR